MPRLAANLSMMFNEVPFLDRFDLATLKSERIFVADEKVYEPPLALVSAPTAVRPTAGVAAK